MNQPAKVWTAADVMRPAVFTVPSTMSLPEFQEALIEHRISGCPVIDNGAIGAISTHDLELADDPVLKSLSHTVHFRETITKDTNGRDVMTFDYRMREGVSPTTNALRLLEVVGLGTPSTNPSTGHNPS